MRILLIGEYSNVHWTLAQGLRALGQTVTVVSDGDIWKDYPRDINLKRRSLNKRDSLAYLFQTEWVMRKLRGYDVVQLINPIFLDLKAERMWRYYRMLRKQNGKMFLGAFGMDHYWVKTCLDCKTFLYSDFNMGSEVRHSQENDALIDGWLTGEKQRLNEFIAKDCDGIISGLYEYDKCYRPVFGEKVHYIPYPIEVKEVPIQMTPPEKVRFFIGIQKSRSIYKGTDILLKALEQLQRDYPEKMEIIKAESVPFAQYKDMMRECDALLDQLYSYTPAMNGLNAMSQGLVLVGGGEEEHYQLLGEETLRPIVNVRPSQEDVYKKLEQLVLHTELIPELKRQSLEYIRRHHDHKKVAQQYLDLYQENL